ncbi:ERF family protein [Cupriavidus metallidurans]|jgi:ERF superfamily|uniref:ERF family protein n=1 Tax=Cupriavidus metallidurans TaxID=119219 RepID=UPI000CE05566|nr:ERF family protein [Cupriavidus metallidurans]AVA33340.1 single-stranded DNA-binding protein [Cupriavidus metallidurans]
MSTAVVEDVIDVETAPTTPRTAALPATRQSGALATTGPVTPDTLLLIAVEKGADLDYISKLLDLRERGLAMDARKAYVKAMAAFKTEPITIRRSKEVGYKTREGDFVGYTHAELSDVTDAVGPAMAKHGLSFAWNILQDNGLITVECVITHELGHSEKVVMSGPPDNSGKKNVIQQTASTITYLQRYTLLAVTGMSTKGMDDDGAGGSDAAGGQPSAGSQPNTAAQRSESSALYSQERFDENKAKWRELILSKKKTPTQIIATVESKGVRMTEGQKNTIDSWSHEND